MAASVESPTKPPLPTPLFGRATHLLGWQGLTLPIPENWNLASFGGNYLSGNLRADDEDGPRLEIRWETPQKSVDLPKSVADFVGRLEKQARRDKRAFEPNPDANLLPKARKRKAQLQSFGWKGEVSGGGRQREGLAAHGWGVAWQCETCGRVVLSHFLGRETEKPGRTGQLASELFASLECHGTGGWSTWAVFDLQLDIPDEFALERAKLLTGRLELEWRRPAVPGLLGLPIGPKAQSIGLTRLAAANVLLETEELEAWTQRVLAHPDKKRRWGVPQAASVRHHEGVRLEGEPRDWRRRLREALLDRVLQRETPPATLQVWHCEPGNKLFALDCELSPANAHVARDVLDSLPCH